MDESRITSEASRRDAPSIGHDPAGVPARVAEDFVHRRATLRRRYYACSPHDRALGCDVVPRAPEQSGCGKSTESGARKSTTAPSSPKPRGTRGERATQDGEERTLAPVRGESPPSPAAATAVMTEGVHHEGTVSRAKAVGAPSLGERADGDVAFLTPNVLGVRHWSRLLGGLLYATSPRGRARRRPSLSAGRSTSTCSRVRVATADCGSSAK